MVTLFDIIKTTKFGPTHKIYLICIIKIPFFLSFKLEKQREYLSLSVRTIYRIREDFVELNIIKKRGQSDFTIDWVLLKKLM